ncbi:MAG: V/A-type H+-transporting ATPase subunit E [Candidatus Nanohaloarchaea archaeon]|jgi:V/A-type H+-transporting ATPase subunit E
MGLQQVKDEILDEAEEKSAEIKEEAEQYREEKLEEAKEEVERIKEEAKQEIEDQKEDIEQKEISNARMKAKRKKLEAQKDEINKVFDEFEEEIKDLSEEEAENMLENATDEISFEVGKVVGSSEFQEAVDDADIEFEERDKPGFVVLSENGERRRDYSFEKIFKEFEENHRKQVADKLFK